MADEPDPAAIADAAAAFRDDYDDGDFALESVLAVDAEHETWTFDDIPLDSGTFGELVSRGIVTKSDGEYRIVSREGVRAGLEGRELSLEGGSNREAETGRAVPISVDGRTAVAVVGALVVLFGMRALNYRAVFRGDRVVSPANDPYYYRYWMEQLLAESNGPTDWSVVTAMPDGAAETRPLTHAGNWFLAELLGGDQWAADMVAAWLPVAATVCLGVVIYWLAVVVTDDVRVGVASVLLFALTPVHAVYTGLGFLEHRLYQYFWIGVTLLTLAWLAVDLRRRERESTPRETVRGHLRRPWTWLAAIALAIAIGLSMHTWGGSVLLLVPVAVYAGLKVAVDVREGLPVLANVPILVGLAGGWLLAAFLHVRWGWHQPFVAVVPLLVAVGAGVVIALGKLWRRTEWPVGGLVGLEGGLAVLGLLAVRQLRPAEWARLTERAGDLFLRTGIAETVSLFSIDDAVVFGPIIQLGVEFYVALLVLGWACWVASRRYEPGWLLLAVYAVFWLALATIQGRFAAQLAVPLSIFGGVGLVYLLAWADLARVPKPFRRRSSRDRQAGHTADRGTVADGGEHEPSIVVPRDPKTLVALLWIGLLICGLSLIFVPSLSAQTTHDDAKLEAATAIDEHAEDVGREYPENFVLSKWGDNRFYNYFVSGEAERYTYAFNTFEEFRTDEDPDDWYATFDESDVGYVVMTDASGGYAVESSRARLHDELGTGGDGREPLAHYQAVYLHDNVTAFAVVPGATIVADAEPGETVTVETDVTVSGETIQYEREVTADENGRVTARVPYPGEYTVDGRSVDVSTAAVESGESVRLE
ncbi:hypothetical protein [Halopiger djelfimassiliensis]|uniref:hypothetical protein n=1 Tax=Halopiger djelfimassiliensis TaxID=1293047 RepID=UPI0006780EB2|nr:hypothetical protein [Halopiger djelfimassiliensis]